MNPRQNFAALCGLLAAAAAVVFFAISIDHGVYAPGAWELHTNDQLGAIRDYTPARFQGEVNSFWLLRKLYSIIAFSIVGFFVAPAIEKDRRIRTSTLLIASFSAVIEVAQWLTGAREGLFSNGFDIACGALGGSLGALCFNLVIRLRPRRK